jgi:chromosome segregation ATPase
MRSSIIMCVSLIVLLSCCEQAVAQTNSAVPQTQANQERLLRELLDEVRLLRATLQRIESNNFNAQVTLDRLRAQQEQVLRLTREVADIREKIIELRVRQQTLSLKIPELEKEFQAGLKTKTEWDHATQELEELRQREQNLAEREKQVSVDLQTARGSLLELNGRLDALERDIRSVTGGEVKTPVRKQQ